MMEDLVTLLVVSLVNLAGWVAIWYKLGKLEGQSDEHRRQHKSRRGGLDF